MNLRKELEDKLKELGEKRQIKQRVRQTSILAGQDTWILDIKLSYIYGQIDILTEMIESEKSRKESESTWFEKMMLFLSGFCGTIAIGSIIWAFITLVIL